MQKSRVHTNKKSKLLLHSTEELNSPKEKEDIGNKNDKEFPSFKGIKFSSSSKMSHLPLEMALAVCSHCKTPEFFFEIGAVCNTLEDVVVKTIEELKNAIAFNLGEACIETTKLPSCLPDRIARSIAHLHITTDFSYTRNENRLLQWLMNQCERLNTLVFDCTRQTLPHSNLCRQLAFYVCDGNCNVTVCKELTNISIKVTSPLWDDMANHWKVWLVGPNTNACRPVFKRFRNLQKIQIRSPDNSSVKTFERSQYGLDIQT